MPARTQAATARCAARKREEEDAPTEAEVLRFFDLFLEEERQQEARAETQDQDAEEAGDGASDDGWEQVQGRQEDAEEDEEEDKQSVSAASTVSSSSSDSSRGSVGTSRSSSSSSRSSVGLAPPVGLNKQRGLKMTKVETAPPPPPSRLASSTLYQHRQRQELEYLKTKERELEQRLRQLEREADQAASERDGWMWQRVARQQQLASQKAMAENAQLQLMVSEQLKFSKSLEKAIRKRPLFAGGDEDKTPTRGTPTKRRQPLSAPTMARSLRARASHAHEQVDKVLAQSSVRGMTRDYHGFEIKARPDPMTSGNNQLRLEWINVRRLPFRFSAVAREIWNFLADASILEQSMPGMTRRVERWGDELLATTDLVFPVGGRSAVLHAAAGFRLSMSSESAHINWVSHGECRAKKSAKGGFQIIEKGWTSIEPLPGSEDACIVRTVNYHTPSVVSRGDDDSGGKPADEEASADEIGILTELICSAYDKSLGFIYAVIQNALMEKALRGQGASD